MRPRQILLRVAAGLTGAALFVVAAYGTLFVFLAAGTSAQTPDPNVEDGDPCCGYPDTWSEVAQGIGLGLVEAAVVGGVFAIAVALMVRAARNRWPPRRRLVWIPVAAVLVTAGMAGVVLAVP